MTCYRTFRGRKSPCPNCPLTSAEQSCIIENSKLGVRVRAQATTILWNGREERLITCYDMNNSDPT